MSLPTEESKAQMIDGIDVAYAQGKINWGSVAAAGNIKFACAKISEGASGVDPQIVNNWQPIKDNGIIRGAYHFARPDGDPNDAVIEATHFISKIPSLELEDFLALDVEVSQIQGSKFVEWVLAWIETVELKTGKMPFIYTGGPFFTQYAGTVSATVKDKLSKYPLWLAAYVKNPDKFVPQIWKETGWTIWQKSGDIAASGETPLRVKGINSVVDYDVFKGSEEDLKSLILNLHSGSNNGASSAVATIINNSSDTVS